MREKKRLAGMLATEAELVRREEDISAYFDLAREGEKVDADLRREIDSLAQLVDRLETETLLSGTNDALNAIIDTLVSEAVPPVAMASCSARMMDAVMAALDAHD